MWNFIQLQGKSLILTKWSKYRFMCVNLCSKLLLNVRNWDQEISIANLAQRSWRYKTIYYLSLCNSKWICEIRMVIFEIIVVKSWRFEVSYKLSETSKWNKASSKIMKIARFRCIKITWSSKTWLSTFVSLIAIQWWFPSEWETVLFYNLRVQNEPKLFISSGTYRSVEFIQNTIKQNEWRNIWEFKNMPLLYKT